MKQKPTGLKGERDKPKVTFRNKSELRTQTVSAMTSTKDDT